MKRILTIALAAVSRGAGRRGNGRYPETIALPNGWQPEGIATGERDSFYCGSRATGAVFKGDLKTRARRRARASRGGRLARHEGR